MASSPDDGGGELAEYLVASISYLGLMAAGVASIARGADPFAVVPVVGSIAGLAAAQHVQLRRTHGQATTAAGAAVAAAEAMVVTEEGDQLPLSVYVQTRSHRIINGIQAVRLAQDNDTRALTDRLDRLVGDLAATVAAAVVAALDALPDDEQGQQGKPEGGGVDASEGGQV